MSKYVVQRTIVEYYEVKAANKEAVDITDATPVKSDEKVRFSQVLPSSFDFAQQLTRMMNLNAVKQDILAGMKRRKNDKDREIFWSLWLPSDRPPRKSFYAPSSVEEFLGKHTSLIPRYVKLGSIGRQNSPEARAYIPLDFSDVSLPDHYDLDNLVL